MSAVKTPTGWTRVRCVYPFSKKSFFRFLLPVGDHGIAVLERKGYSRGDLPGWVAGLLPPNANTSDWRQLAATIAMPSGDFAPDPSALARRVERHFKIQPEPSQ